MNRIVLVTGAGSGIGAATAAVFATDGSHVVCVDVDGPAAAATARALSARGHSASSAALDVRDEHDWEQVVGRSMADHGRLDVLVSCAGVSSGSPLADTELGEWRRVLATNLDGAFLATKHGLRAMRERGGVIVHVGSASGIRAAPGAAAYSVSKAGLGMLVRVAAKECRDGGIPVRVCAVSPAGVRTPMWERMPFFQEIVTQTGSVAAAFDALEQGGGGKFSDPEDVARVIRFLASDDARHLNGVEIPADSGYVL
ncbi:MAG: SDR family oxidoreductase [Deltaproteobacteria bacterium]|nr:SDR family oxidoreductase [Deltaproteobacteria bacterium]